MKSILEPCVPICLATMVWISSLLFHAPVIATGFELSPSASNLAKAFSDKYCQSIADGISSESSVKAAAGKMIGGLIFSGAMQEITSIPQEDMVAYLSSIIIDKCGEKLALSKQELFEQMDQLASIGLG